MNMLFWSLLLLMLLVAIALLVYPLLRVRKSDSVVYQQSNLALYEDKLRELSGDFEDGRIDRAHFQRARDELDRELLLDVPGASTDNAAEYYKKPCRPQPAVAIVVTAFVPLLAFFLYLNLGMHAAGEAGAPATVAEQAAGTRQPSVPEMAAALLQHITEKGGSAQDWTMLGRAYKYMKEYDKAASAFAEALEMTPDDVPLLLERAEVIALQNGRLFVPEAQELIKRAVQLAPDNFNVLWFAGVAAYQTGEYRQAIDFLGRLARTEAVGDSAVRESIVVFVSKAREKLLAKGEQVAELADLLAIETTDAPADDAPVARIRVAVDVSAEVREKFRGSDDVFVYAKAMQGPRMPLAVKRMKLAQFPATVELDDSMAMVQGMTISAFGQVMVSARVTKSGSAIAQEGDYIGQVAVSDVYSEKTIKLKIDKLVEK